MNDRSDDPLHYARTLSQRYVLFQIIHSTTCYTSCGALAGTANADKHLLFTQILRIGEGRQIVSRVEVAVPIKQLPACKGKNNVYHFNAGISLFTPIPLKVLKKVKRRILINTFTIYRN